MKDLTSNDLLALESNALEEMEVAEWNGKIYLKVMSAVERSAIEDFFMKIKESKKDSAKFRKEMLRKTMADKEGNLLLADEAVANSLMAKPGQALVLESIFEKACQVNGFREKDVDTLKKK